MFLHELVSEQTNKYGFFEYDAQTYKSSFQEHMKNLYQDIFYCELQDPNISYFNLYP